MRNKELEKKINVWLLKYFENKELKFDDLDFCRLCFLSYCFGRLFDVELTGRDITDIMLVTDRYVHKLYFG